MRAITVDPRPLDRVVQCAIETTFGTTFGQRDNLWVGHHHPRRHREVRGRAASDAALRPSHAALPSPLCSAPCARAQWPVAWVRFSGNQRQRFDDVAVHSFLWRFLDNGC